MLSPSAVANAKPGAKPYKLADERGMFLLVNPTGSRWWRFKYRRPGTRKENLLSLGTYPDVSLKRAREKRDEARRLLADGIDPGDKRKAEDLAAANTFEAVAREWFAKFSTRWAPSHAGKVLARLENDLFPWIGNKPIAGMTAPDVLSALRRVESRGAVETAHRALQNCGQVFRYAVATGRAQGDVTRDLRGSLAPVQKGHFASITEPEQVGELLRAIDGFVGQPATMFALKLAPLVFVRPGELRHAQWPEIDLEGAIWRIPAEKMKMKAAHLVPLSTQAVAILRELKPYTDHGTGNGYLFPSARTPFRPMSENTITAALRRLGYSGDEMTGHGFRSMAATRLNEMGWRADAIERQLAHAESNKVREAYTSAAQYLDERAKMIQTWTNYLDKLKNQNSVVPMKRHA